MVKVSTTRFIHWAEYDGVVQIVDKHSGWHHRLEGFTVGSDGTLYGVPHKGWLAIETENGYDVHVEARLAGDELTFHSLDDEWHVVDEWTAVPLVREIEDEDGEWVGGAHHARGGRAPIREGGGSEGRGVGRAGGQAQGREAGEAREVPRG